VVPWVSAIAMTAASPAVLHVTNWRFRGGGTGVARVLFDAGGKQAYLLCFEEASPRGQAVEVEPREYTSAIWDFRASLDLARKLIARHGSLVVHSHGRRPGLHARLMRARLGTRVGVVHSFHGIASFSGLKKWLSAMSESALSLFTQRLVADGPAEIDLFRYLPLACPALLLMPPYTPRNVVAVTLRPPRRVGMSARLVQPKLHVQLIDAISAYNRMATIPLELAFTGDGPDADAIRRHGEAQLGDKFSLLGHVPDLAQFHASIDIFAFFSRFEGLSLSLVDALACGLPCIATDVIGCNVALTHEYTGLLVPVDDTAAAVAAFSRLCSDDELRTRLANTARRVILERHSPEKFWLDHLQMYRDVVQELSGSPT
jgi:glycosyltransferase involved in cell wall biosynthesis